MSTICLSTVLAPSAPRPALVTAGALGISAALVVPNGPPGIGLVLLGLAAAAALWRMSPRPVLGWRAVHAIASVLLLSMVAVRAAEWVVLLDLTMAIGVGSLALTGAGGWPGVLRGLVEVGLMVPRALGWLGRGVRDLPLAPAAAGPVLKGAALTALLLLVFVPLLVSADAAFAEVLGALVPNLPDLGLLPVRLVVGCMAAVGMGAAVLVLLAPRPEPVVSPPRRRLSRAAEWLLPLAVLDGLLALFLAVQMTVLFGGDEHVLRAAGVTYASYAREGFGQLVAVAALVLAVVAASVRWAPRTARPALGVLCGLALVVDASALWRLHLYVDAYGLTRLRVLATALACWLGLVLVVVLVAGVRPGRWVPHASVASAAAGLLILSAVNPDARIASSVLARGQQADLVYASGLSADAATQLDRLPEPLRSCALRRAAMADEDRSWTSASLGRHRAQRLTTAAAADCPAVR